MGLYGNDTGIPQVSIDTGTVNADDILAKAGTLDDDFGKDLLDRESDFRQKFDAGHFTTTPTYTSGEIDDGYNTVGGLLGGLLGGALGYAICDDDATLVVTLRRKNPKIVGIIFNVSVTITGETAITITEQDDIALTFTGGASASVKVPTKYVGDVTVGVDGSVTYKKGKTSVRTIFNRSLVTYSYTSHIFRMEAEAVWDIRLEVDSFANSDFTKVATLEKGTVTYLDDNPSTGW